MATAQNEIRPAAQADFSGGANPFGHPLLLGSDEVVQLTNAFPRLGGGADARRGYKLYPLQGSTVQGTSIFEVEQSTGTILTYRDQPGPTWYDETMWPRYRLFDQTPRINDAAYFGAREPFNQLIMLLIYGYIAGSDTQGLVFEYFKGGNYLTPANWVDFTASVVGGVANDKHLVAFPNPREILLTWPTLALWAPGQVETRTFQYWIRIRVTVDLQNGGQEVLVGQRRVRSDWVGRRHMMSASTGFMWEWPGITLTQRNVASFPTGQTVPRVNGAVLNDHFYYALAGQMPLQRWNGGRGTTRLGGSNVPGNAGLTAPAAAPVLTQPTANPASYPNGYVGRYRIVFVHGPEGILGPSAPSASAVITIALGPNQIRVGLAAAIAQAATLPVSAIDIYATYDQAGTLASQADFLGNFLLVKTVLRDDADWNNGYWEDPFVERIQRSPINYNNSPPFYPKFVTVGAHRLIMANENVVAMSDIDRGDSWDPSLQFPFPGGIRGVLYHDDMTLVWHGDDISFIRGINEGQPETGYLNRGIGLAQSDTLAVWNNEVHWVSQYGPARLVNRQVQLTAKGRVWEVTPYWNGSAAQRRFAPGAAFEGRVWFGVDRSGAGPGLSRMATLDLLAGQRGAWSDHVYGTLAAWGALGVIHAPLDHELARQLILCAFPDGSYTADYYKLALLEYGTTDNWTAVATDGTKILSTILTRALPMGAVDRWKKFVFGHVRHRLHQATAGVGLAIRFVSGHGRVASKTLTQNGSGTSVDQDFFFQPTETAGGGRFRETTPSMELAATSDDGWTLAEWALKAEIEDQKNFP